MSFQCSNNKEIFNSRKQIMGLERKINDSSLYLYFSYHSCHTQVAIYWETPLGSCGGFDFLGNSWSELRRAFCL